VHSIVQYSRIIVRNHDVVIPSCSWHHSVHQPVKVLPPIAPAGD
jgi:hypothetical protein